MFYQEYQFLIPIFQLLTRALVAPSFALVYARASEGQAAVINARLVLRSFGKSQSEVGALVAQLDRAAVF